MALADIFRRVLGNYGDDVANKVAGQYADDVVSKLAASSADDIAAKQGNLIATHQLTPEKLQGAADLGGFVQPSMAVVDPRKGTNFLPGSDFGDIVMVANRESINPAGAAKTVLGDRDIYSPRFPTTTYKMNDDALREFAAANNMSDASARSNLSLDELYSHAMEDAFQKQHPQFADAYVSEIRNAPEFNKFAQENLDKLRGDKIIRYTNRRGTEKELPLTAQNASDAMNELANIGSEQGFTPPTATAYTNQTKNIKNLDDLYKLRYRLVDSATGNETKQAIDDEFSRVLEGVRGANLPHIDNDSFFSDEAADYLNDVLKRPSVARQAKSELPEELIQDINDLRKVYKEAPVSYFEAKPRRVVNGDEFHGAYVPESAPQSVIDDLSRLGVNNVQRYTDKEALEAALRELADKGKRGVSPWVLGAAGVLPVGILNQLLSSNTGQSTNDIV